MTTTLIVDPVEKTGKKEDKKDQTIWLTSSSSVQTDEFDRLFRSCLEEKRGEKEKNHRDFLSSVESFELYGRNFGGHFLS